MPEYLEFRCCLCPNQRNPQETVCPPSFMLPKPTPCRFVKTYIDTRSWLYKVMGGLGESNFKARYQKPGKKGWKCMGKMPWRKSFDEAQSDLNGLAKKKGWSEHDAVHRNFKDLSASG